MKQSLTTTQIGSIGEHFIASHIMLASNGRLAPFLPMADDDGIDLILFDKVTRHTIPIQVKSRTGIDGATRNTVQFDVRLKTFSSGSMLLAVLFDWKKASVDKVWILPMDVLIDVAHKTKDKLSIRPSPSLSSKDRYIPFRCDDFEEVTRRILDTFDHP